MQNLFYVDTDELWKNYISRINKDNEDEINKLIKIEKMKNKEMKNRQIKNKEMKNKEIKNNLLSKL